MVHIMATNKDIARKQLQRKAETLLSRVNATMQLENQSREISSTIASVIPIAMPPSTSITCPLI